MKKILASAAILALLPLAACSPTGGAKIDVNCQSPWEFSTIKEGTLQVAGITGLPYLDIPAGSSSATGIDGDLYAEFGKRACLEVVFQALGGPAAVGALSSGKVDAAAGGWYATEERGKTIGQSNTVWLNYNSVAIAAPIASVSELKGKTVGVVGGSVYVEPLEKAIGADHLRQYQTPDAILQDLKAGRIDAGMGTSGEMQAQMDNRKITDFQVQLLEEDSQFPELTAVGNVNLPHAKENTKLTVALNAFIAEIEEDGTLKAILAKYGMDDPKYLPAAS